MNRARMSATAWSSAPTIAGVHISHPDRLIYPDAAESPRSSSPGITKALPTGSCRTSKGRPLTLVHCPAGIASPCIYLKHAKQWGPSALRRVKIQEKTKVGEYLVADSIEALVSLAQMGIVEVHTWNAADDDVERPNRIVWDLDPGPEVAWKEVVAAAKVVRDALKALELESWVKTTGGRGLHVVMPIKRRRDWSECLEFSRGVSETIERSDPQRYTTTFAKAGRERKILIDYLRNNRTNTSVCAFSPRARPGAMVSMPLEWRELGSGPERWTLLTAAQRLKRLKTDPWAGYWTASQGLSNASIRAVARHLKIP